MALLLETYRQFFFQAAIARFDSKDCVFPNTLESQILFSCDVGEDFIYLWCILVGCIRCLEFSYTKGTAKLYCMLVRYLLEINLNG